MKRENTKVVYIGNVPIGGGNPIAIQSMTNTKTEDVKGTVAQILELEKVGCDIIRVAVPTMEAAKAISEIKKEIHIPLVADIHFDYKLAIAAMEYGADKIRINPGNIGSKERVAEVVEKAKEKNIPIRVGVNSGSLEKNLLEKYGKVCPEALVESALDKINLIKGMGYDNLVLSIKSSDVLTCVEVYKLAAESVDCPLHVGITEAGTLLSGNIKSSIGLGLILNEGIGDTIRVSLTGEPKEEIKSAKIILKTLGLRKGGVEVVSCPTCGRTRIDLIGLANQVEELVEDIPLDIKVAVMGCVVNGPGEAKDADIGVAGGIGEGVLIKKGEIVKKVKEDKLLETLRWELMHWNE
ncbi:(E)-4-hydroxy-3-methylbut-2-enyl-diphosphate synthase [Aequitasia blattaphilus]|uniref:4-hydroxy-3-methylbut-2-en-1-yl diphosphate synthase (flavodoxin) n=1 Tax=Aequitasia blattaphilus TaxID=2949332 RepID=A0ABT1E8Z4_9FIRM|nr:flavodoxin-dependent (E)-4-hydroxy-3-methylbut-2-enyl-diphosphate synthase [Aequitasia blattaphilus]MCP1102305.1 flavodoxin-dependent (E)-4-hydroxy-3-methylbut-2-enyl-diphosphate synthase [Aequitasia blattaphilus]MCR8614945.1 flavodoxin-dependent (E)-4-hydroxy-3-methylbut-2-enyl-diphosphate synthase [Aequitasia blattaphilus]